MAADEVIAYARTFLGVPYVWGGNNRLQGLDCGGALCEWLRAFGLVRRDEDLNSGGLWARFGNLPSVQPQPGAIAFFGKPPDLRHVALCVSSSRMIEAGGGDATTTDFAKAARVGAMVRERPIAFRSDLIKCVMPPYAR